MFTNITKFYKQFVYCRRKFYTIGWIANVNKSNQITMNKFLSVITALILVFTITSCKKVEGPGGQASITGKIHALVHDGAGNLINEYDIEKYDVYLIYGNDAEETYFDDDIETSYDGTFRFEYLEKGNYQLFVYSKCVTCPSGKEVLIQDVEITDKKGTVDVGTINIEK